MSPIPGIPFCDFLDLFGFDSVEIEQEIMSSRLVIIHQEHPVEEDNRFISLADFRIWVNHPDTPLRLRDMALARIKNSLH